MPSAVSPPTVAAAFDRAAATWDEAHGPSSERAREFDARIRYLRTLCRRFDRPAVLELGCATGQNLLHIADLIATGIGLDVSPAMIARARANAASLPDRLRFVVGDAIRFDDPGAPFDIVLLIGTLEHLTDPAAAIANAGRMLARDGRLVVVMPHPLNPAVLLHRLLTRAATEPPARHLAPRSLAALAAGQGLGLVALRGLPYAPWPRLRLTRGRRARPAIPWVRPLSGIVRGAYAAEFRRLEATPTGRKSRPAAPSPWRGDEPAATIVQGRLTPAHGLPFVCAMSKRGRDREVMVLGDAVAHGILLWATCRACGHRAVVNPAEVAQRCGYDVPVRDVEHRMRCSRCGGRDVELTANPGASGAPPARETDA